MLSGLRAELAASATPYLLIEPRLPPHVGAALYAAKISGQPLSPASIAALMRTEGAAAAD